MNCRLTLLSFLLLPGLLIYSRDNLQPEVDRSAVSPEYFLFVPVKSGNKQTQMANFPLPQPVRVLVKDSLGKPVEGIEVYFFASGKPAKSEGFTCNPSVALTNSEGIAITQVKLGSKDGPYELVCRIRGNIQQDTLIYSFDARKKNWVILLITGLLGGLGLFMFGMKMMSTGMQNSAGDKMRAILGKMTSNRVVALLVGVGVTTIIQSSSATSVMLVGFVNSRLMEFRKTIAIILGAVIGTTITAQIIAFKITDYALLIIAAGFFTYLLSNKPRTKSVGEAILGFGILFFGMYVMSEAMYPLRSYDPFINALTGLENPLLGLLIGIIFTALIQSSSAFIGIMIVLASQGMLTLEASIPMLFGSNIGTAITAILASLNASREAKKVAVAMTIFKIIGVSLMIWWVPVFAELVERFSPKAAADVSQAETLAAVLPRQIANAHTYFNVFMAMVALPFTHLLARLVDYIMPAGKKEEGLQMKTFYLDNSFINTPSFGLNLAKQEALRLAELIREMVFDIIFAFTKKDDQVLPPVREKEELVNFLTREINSFLSRLTRGNISSGMVAESFQIMYVVNEFEQIGDIVSKVLGGRAERWLKEDSEFSEEGKNELKDFHRKVMKQLFRATEVFRDMNLEAAREMKLKYKKYRHIAVEFEMQHYQRLKSEISKSTASSETHLELITMLKNIASHATNIARLFIEHEQSLPKDE